MNPLLKSPDILHVRPYGRRTIRRGDVVVFSLPEGNRKVVHRVVSVDNSSVRTKGDDNPEVDPWIVKPETVIGRVEWIERQGRRIRIHGGVAGRIQVRARKAARMIHQGASSVLSPIYQRLAQNLALKKWFAGRMTTRMLSLNRPEGTERHLLLGRLVIGRCPAGKSNWLIKRPFRLFIDEQFLP